jgi:signal peptidase I
MTAEFFQEISRKIRHRIFGQSGHDLRDAGRLISNALLAGADIRTGLVKAKENLTAEQNGHAEEKAAAKAYYREMLRRIEKALEGSSHKGVSLVDGSGSTLELADGDWKRTIEPHDLRSGAEGLNLPTPEEVTGEAEGMKGVLDSLDRAIGKVDRMVSKYGADVQAIESRAGLSIASGDEGGQKSDKSPTREIVEIVAAALVIALFVRSFLFQPFNIPSGSMKSTLLIGDYVFVSKYSYGYGAKSFPFGIPDFAGRFFFSEPERGDIVVFKKTEDGKTDFIKRLIGLPGDRVQMKAGVLYINDEAVKKELVDEFLDNDPRNYFPPVSIQRFRETLPNGVAHMTLDEIQDHDYDDTAVYVVPEGHYFFMGDNRDNSADSRVIGGGVDFVPADYLIGRAEIIFFSVDGTARLWEVWKWPTAIRYRRLFMTL